MEASRVTLLTLLCVVFCSQQRIFGAEVEMKVRPGENVIIYSDCYCQTCQNPGWFKNSSDGNQSRPLITRRNVAENTAPPRYTMLNLLKNKMDLLIINFTKSDQGIYFCSIKIKKSVHSYGSRSTRLVILEEAPPPSRDLSEPSAGENGFPGWSCSWQLLVSVSAGCVLLSSLFSSIGVYYLCRKNLKAEVHADQGGSDKRLKPRSDEGVETEVCYSLLDCQYN